MKSKTLLAAIVSTFVISHSSFGQGALTPTGAPAPSMKSLAQIEPRTPISAAPFTISQPGSYYLTANVNVTSGSAIIINANQVSLDLNGFTISSTEPVATSGTYGIKLGASGGNSDVTIFNGHIRGGVTNNAYYDYYAGSGFGSGIGMPGSNAVNILVKNLSVMGCQEYGIDLGSASVNTIAVGCTVESVGKNGIQANLTARCTATDCLYDGIDAKICQNCRGESSEGMGIRTFVAENCYGFSVNDGFGLSAGISAWTADHCTGVSSGTDDGLDANTANNCSGTTSSGQGIHCQSALNCYAFATGSGDGLVGATAIGCSGFAAGSGPGIYNYIAIGCSGSSVSGEGLATYIANSCVILNGTNNINFKYNMP